MKPLLISPHAFQRFLRRQISRAEVERTVRTPDLIQPARRGRLRAIKELGERKLHVFYKETPGSVVIVTAYWRDR